MKKVNYTFGRIIVTRFHQTNHYRLSELLKIIKRMKSNGEKCEYLVTPGGFLTDSAMLPFWSGAIGWKTIDIDTTEVFEFGDAILEFEKLFSNVLKEAKKVANYISIGVDLKDYERKCNAEIVSELVCLIDLNSKKRYWTGKSYPTPSQQNNIVLVSNLDSHFVKLDNGNKVCILGCHDLNLLSHRTMHNTVKGGNRRNVIDEFQTKLKKFKPAVIIQHPHSTDTPNIWKSGWSGVRSDFTFVKEWVSGIAYCRVDHKKKCRATLEKTLERTTCGSSAYFKIGDRNA